MAVILQIHWEGVTPRQYDDLSEKTNWYGDPPEGGIFHVAWFEKDGLHVFDVWESREHFHRFFENWCCHTSPETCRPTGQVSSSDLCTP